MVEAEVDMDHGKNDEDPHQDVMDVPGYFIPSEHRYDLGKQFGEPAIAHGSIHAKSGKRLHQEDQILQSNIMRSQ